MAEARATLVLLPGLDGTDIFFRPLLAALPAWIEARCVQYDAAGPYEYLDLLPVIRDACRSCRDFFVLGWSFSGPLALMLAAESPPGLRGVLLCASFISPPWPFIRFLRSVTTASVARLFPFLSQALALFGRYASDQFRRDRGECWARVPPSVFAARARTIFGMDLRSTLPCHVPLLYVRGSADIVVPRWNARAVSRAIPSARVVTIDGPHLALYTNPTKAADVIAEFIREQLGERDG
jgi:pimeloyl-[acyl-carrier protein] methyl ester esterase